MQIDKCQIDLISNKKVIYKVNMKHVNINVNKCKECNVKFVEYVIHATFLLNSLVNNNY